MNQAEVEVQLKVWKELAVSKQMLMKAATDALELQADCTAEELKQALAETIEHGKQADARIKATQDETRQQLDAMEKRIKASEKAQKTADQERDTAQTKLDKFERDMAVERQAHLQEMKVIKAQISERDREIKAIHKALADTPENVVKKLKQLKKQKTDEADARKQIEAQAAGLRKEKRKVEESLSAAEENLKKAEKLVKQFRELHELAKEWASDEKQAKKLPVVDEEMLKDLEKAVPGKDKKGGKSS